MANAELLLFAFRLIAGVLLGSILLILFLVMWRDYRSALTQIEARKRAYGRLIGIQEIDGTTVLTGQTYPLLPLTSLGRAPTNTIPIQDTFASSEHALVALRNGQWWLEDRHSKNGTLLNGIPVTQPTIITDGDIIGIGSMRFQIVLEA
ncbi:FHA domain-containing protein [Anaerolineae bacterium CFX9]|nr:FHA domain-containing protein [Kamptonema cortianum]MDL1900736.1 FHA domain-containing protein [Anaerolineae bacterium CFX9]